MADGYISQIQLPDSKVYDFRDQHLKVYTGSCTTAAGTAIKDVTTDGKFTLAKGAVIFVNFSTTNTAAVADLKLRVNSNAANDAKPIKHEYNASEANLPAAGYLRANQTYQFYYDGTNWVTDVGRDANSTYSYMRPYENTGKGSYNSQGENPVKTGAGGWRFQLSAGKYFMYSHYYDNTAQSALTLNIGSTGAKPIYINGQPSSADNYTLPGGQYLVYYDGTNYYFRTDDKMTGNITGNAATVNGHTVGKDVPSDAVFTDTNKYHKTGSWSGLTYTATAVNSADELKFTIPTGTSGTTVAVGNHNHNINNLTNASSYLKWQTTTAESTALYDFGVYVNMNNANGSSMNGGNYFNILNVPYRKASGNIKADWGWQLGNTTSNDGRLWYRTAGDNVWGEWQTIAHATQSTSDTGSSSQPVYMTKTGVITPITAVGAAYGGTGKTTLKDSANALINALDTGSSPLTANDYVITQYVGGGTTTTTYHRRPANQVVNGTLVKAALGTVGTTAKKFLKDTGDWTQVAFSDLSGTATNAQLAHSKVTIAGNDVSLGGSLTAATLTSSLGLSNALHFIGITSTTLSDGSTTSTLTAKSTNSLSKTTGFVDGDVVMDGDQLREYVWSGNAWHLLGITTSTAYTQPASTATNTWIAQISQGTDGKITATTGSLNTSGTWSGKANTAGTADKAIADANGYNLDDTYAKSYIQVIDLTTDDITKWYPVTIQIPANGLRRVACVTQLNSGHKPSWSSHSAGYTAVVEMLVTAIGWGVTGGLSICLTDDQRFLNANEPKPIGFSQFGNSSRATFWCRGGAKYRLLTDFFGTWTVYKTDTTATSETIGPKTANPGISFSKSTITANLSGNATSASKWTTARTLTIGNKGQSVDGSGNVSWSLAEIGAAPAVTGGYLPLSGGKMTGRIYREGTSTSWHKGRDNALVATSILNGYSPFASIKTDNGSWDIGSYSESSYTDDLIFSYVTDTQYSGNSATATARIKFLENGHIVAALDGNATSASGIPQTSTTTAGWRKILLTGGDTYSDWNTAVTNRTAHLYQAVGVSVQPSTGAMHISGSFTTSSTTASTSTTTGALIVGGGIATGAASFLTGSVHIVGSAGSDALVVRGISGCDGNGIRGENVDTTDQGLFLNINGGPVLFGYSDSTAGNYVHVQYNQDASSTSTGAFRVNGGVGIAKKLYVGSTASFGDAITLANNRLNNIGDDIQLGDQNIAGTICIKGKNGNTSIRFLPYSGSTSGDITWDGTKFSITSTNAVDASISGNAATATVTTYLGNIGRQTNMDIDFGTTTYNSKVFVSYADGNTVTNKPPSNAIIFNVAWNNNSQNHYGGQVAVSNSHNTTLYLRGCQNGTWDTAWKTVLDSTNYTTYALALDGSNMTDTVANDLYIPYINTGGTLLASSTNIDRLNFGTYYARSNSAAKLLNGTLPFSGAGFKLITIGGYSTSTRYQFAGTGNYITYRTTSDYSLTNTEQSGWTPWKRIVYIGSNEATMARATDNPELVTYASFSAVGDSTTPVYVTAGGAITACTPYANASVNYATSSGSCTGNAATATAASKLKCYSSTLLTNANVSDVTDYGLTLFRVDDTTTSNGTDADGILLHFNYSTTTNWSSQLFIPDYTTNTTGWNMKWRAHSANTTWTDWKTILDSINYTTYTVKKDGSGASGSWGISITGNAASATKVAAKLAATTKTYLLGTSTAITATAANVEITGDTGVYLTTTAGQLNATTFKVNEAVTLQWNSTDNSLDFIFA